jgi:hypothetical protein
MSSNNLVLVKNEKLAVFKQLTITHTLMLEQSKEAETFVYQHNN